MSVYATPLVYPKVFVNKSSNGLSLPAFAPDSAVQQFSITTDASADFVIQVVISNQKNLPDPTVSQSATNMWAYCAFTDEELEVTYTTLNPYNPTGAVANKIFNIENTGARWVFLVISSYSAGTLLQADISLFS